MNGVATFTEYRPLWRSPAFWAVAAGLLGLWCLEAIGGDWQSAVVFTLTTIGTGDS